MQRIGILLLCAIAAIATAWWLASGGEDAPSESGGAPTSPRAAATFSDDAAPGVPATRSERSGASKAAVEDERANLQPESVESARRPSAELEQRARAWAKSNPPPAPIAPEGANGVAGERSDVEGSGSRAQRVPERVLVPLGLSDEEVARRAAEKFEDSAMSPEEIAEAIEQETQEIREKERIARDLSNETARSLGPPATNP